ncbi:MAG TPA: Ig-like domain-containing protein [Candidatus Udaeobacter sp.]|jgi:beta-lactamase superfamily II metal-dependent hydrolase|nr:Ig-like domain-containing protein [Candidatus Udaeobacter sp.]
MPPGSIRAYGCGLGASLLLSILAITPLAAAPNLNGKLQIIHLDAGQGDGAVLITPGGQVVLIDEGTNFTAGSSPPSCARVLSELQALGVTHVDYHFASHYHADHIGCITSLTGITIDQGWDRGQSYSSQTYTNYATYLGAGRHTLTKGRVFTLDSLTAHPVTITCVALGGDGIPTSDENSKCVVLKISYGEFDEVFGGDLTGYPSGTSSSDTNIETQVGPQVGKVEVYKVHHHGSAYGSYDDWLNATTPKIGIVSCGTGNGYGHPTAAALSRLHNHGVRTYWTETGAGVAPNPAWDKVANNEIRINAVWQPGGVDSVIAPGIADTLTNSGTAVDATPPVVALSSPNGGEVLAAGGTSSITWSASDNISVTSVDVAYSLDDGSNWNTVAVGAANSGSYSWSLPNTPSTTCRARVTAHDGAGNTTAAASASDFTIADQTAPLTQVVAPNGGETWSSAASANIVWNASDNVGVDSVNVDYSLHGAAGPWVAIAHGLPPTPDSLSWTPPDTSSDSALVRVSAFDHALNGSSDASDAYFHVTPTATTGVNPGATAFGLVLYPPEPNPGHDAVLLRFTLPRQTTAKLEILDVGGRRLWRTSLHGLGAGNHVVPWDGTRTDGRRMTAGTYFVRIDAGAATRTTKFTWLP